MLDCMLATRAQHHLTEHQQGKAETTLQSKMCQLCQPETHHLTFSSLNAIIGEIFLQNNPQPQMVKV